MLSSYIPSQSVPGVGRISGTAWSLTDLLLGQWGWEAARGATRVRATLCQAVGQASIAQASTCMAPCL